MTKMTLALAATMISANLYAAERIYIDTWHEYTDKTYVQRNMVCRDSLCATHSQFGKGSIMLSKAQRDQILEAFQKELDRFDINNISKPQSPSLTIKLKYTTDSKRLEIIRHLSVGQLVDVSPELTAVIKTYLGQDFANPQFPKSAADERKPTVAPAQQF